MHILGAATTFAARTGAAQAVTPTLREITAGRHLSTLAFSEAGSRSHFWAPVSRARRNANGIHISAKKSWVTSASYAQSYVVFALSPEGAGSTDSTLYLLTSDTSGLSVVGLGMVWDLEWSGHACHAVAMRDTDLGWLTKIVAATGGPISSLADLKNKPLAIGSRDSGHAAILPVHFLEQQGMHKRKDYRSLRFNSDLGNHGDTGTSEVEVKRTVLDGRADAALSAAPSGILCAARVWCQRAALREIWSSPAYNHCMFTARPDFDRERKRPVRPTM